MTKWDANSFKLAHGSERLREVIDTRATLATDIHPNVSKDGAACETAESACYAYAEPFPLTHFCDIDTSPKKAWCVEDTFGQGEMSVCYGQPGCGKSTIIGDVAFHVAAGWSWNGKAVTQGAVLILAAERGSVTERRMAAIKVHYRISKLPLAIVRGPCDLSSSPCDTDRLIATAKSLSNSTELPIRIIVVDTKMQVLMGDENSGKDVGAFIRNIARLQQATGAHVIIIDHVPHADQSRMRGHGALLGAADATFSVTKADDLHTFKVEKVNDGPDDVCFAFTFESVELGSDAHTGRITTAPIAVEAEVSDTNRTRKNVRLTNSEENALRLLHEALAEHGKEPPPDPHIPRKTVAVLASTWRRLCQQRQITESSNADAKQRAFNRAANALQRKGLIAIWEDWVWAV
jgi:hypothetical protein